MFFNVNFNRELLVVLCRIADSLATIAECCSSAKPVKGVVLLLDCPTTWEFFNMAKSKKGMVAIPNFTMAELASSARRLPCKLFDGRWR